MDRRCALLLCITLFCSALLLVSAETEEFGPKSTGRDRLTINDLPLHAQKYVLSVIPEGATNAQHFDEVLAASAASTSEGSTKAAGVTVVPATAGLDDVVRPPLWFTASPAGAQAAGKTFGPVFVTGEHVAGSYPTPLDPYGNPLPESTADASVMDCILPEPVDPLYYLERLLDIAGDDAFDDFEGHTSAASQLQRPPHALTQVDVQIDLQRKSLVQPVQQTLRHLARTASRWQQLLYDAKEKLRTELGARCFQESTRDDSINAFMTSGDANGRGGLLHRRTLCFQDAFRVEVLTDVGTAIRSTTYGRFPKKPGWSTKQEAQEGERKAPFVTDDDGGLSSRKPQSPRANKLLRNAEGTPEKIPISLSADRTSLQTELVDSGDACHAGGNYSTVVTYRCASSAPGQRIRWVLHVPEQSSLEGCVAHIWLDVHSVCPLAQYLEQLMTTPVTCRPSYPDEETLAWGRAAAVIEDTSSNNRWDVEAEALETEEWPGLLV